MTKQRLVQGAAFGVLLTLLCPARSLAADLVVNYLDAPGTGFWDTSPVAPIPGSSATTRGEARRIAFAHAASIWAGQLHSLATIEIAARMEALTCSASSGILGQAGPSTLHVDFPGASATNTWFTQALANALTSDASGHAIDLDPQTADITATFSSVLDDPSCLGAISWYYGTDGAAPAQTIDFVTIVLHELAHGLGLLPIFDVQTGAELSGRHDVYSSYLEQHGASPSSLSAMTDAQRVSAAISDPNLHWTGVTANQLATATLASGVVQGHLRMHGPNPLQVGSSLSHVSSAVTPNDFMEPFYTGPNHQLGLALRLLRDLGWRAETPTPVPATGALGAFVVWLGLLLLSATARGGRRRARSTLHAQARALAVGDRAPGVEAL